MDPHTFPATDWHQGSSFTNLSPVMFGKLSQAKRLLRLSFGNIKDWVYKGLKEFGWIPTAYEQTMINVYSVKRKAILKEIPESQ